MRTVIYARFSNDKLQNERSITDQLAICRDRCAREGWEIVGEFTDAGIRGNAGIGSLARPGLSALLAAVEAGGVDQVLAEHTDRIARHQGDSFTIRETFEFAGVRLFTLAQGEITDMTGTVQGLVDAHFSKNLGFKIKRAQGGVVREKRHPAGIAYGYRKANRLDAKGDLIRGLREIDEAQAPIVIRIFTEFAAGISPRVIAEGLNRDKVPAPQAREGAASFWRGSTIYGDRKRKNGILQNQLYIGRLVFNRTRKVMNPRTRKALIRANPESDWQIEEVPDLRILSDAQWEAVQAMLGEVQAGRPEQARRPKHMLSGLVTCGTCGGAWTIRGPSRWGCSRNKEGGPAACANGRTISTRLMEGRVMEGLCNQMLDPEIIAIYHREYHLDFARRASQLDRDSGQLKRHHAEASAKIARLVAAIAAGGEEFAEIREALSKAKAERDALADKLSQIEQLPVIALHPTVIADYKAQVENLSEIVKNPDARLEAIPRLRALVDRVFVRPAVGEKGVTIELTGKLSAMLALATGKPATMPMYGNVGAGEPNCSLPQFLRAVV
jgi:site-specific DNA recombinase